jgi:hypothetical protein
MRPFLLILICWNALAQEDTSWQRRIAAHSECFQRQAASVGSVETLVQRSYGLPPHARIAIGKAADTMYAQYLLHEVVSDYSYGQMLTGAGATLVERREFLSLDGRSLPPVEALRRQKVLDPILARKQTLENLAKLGLYDIAIEYAQLLLFFTTAGQKEIQWSTAPPRPEFVGTDETLVYDWRQTASGALEFLRGKASFHPMSGSVWVRRSDGAPLRVRASFESAEKNRPAVADVATVEYTDSKALGCVAPASVVHRHYVGGKILTENLWTYLPFRVLRTGGKALDPR